MLAGLRSRAAMAGRRAPVWIGMAAIAALSWLYLQRMGQDMAGMGGSMSAKAGHQAMAMSMPMPMAGGGTPSFATAFAMWAVMMMAMMLPTVAPSAAVFDALAARRDQRRGNRVTGLYVAGYAIPWIVFAVPAGLAQSGLTRLLLLDPMAASTSALLSAGILVVAGAYQWMPLKRACLSKCRAPLAFLMSRWRDGATGALVVGVQHGGYCVGCCWALMAVMFVVGAMSLVWMGLFMVLVLTEKVAPAGWRFDRVVGVMLLACGLWIAASGWAGA